MAITSELLGKLGGADVRTVELNIPIENGNGFIDLHTFTIDKPSLVSATLTHDNTDSFRGSSGNAALAITWHDGAAYQVVAYGASYGVSTAQGKPLCVNTLIGSSELTVRAVSNSRSANYIAQTLTLAIIPL